MDRYVFDFIIDQSLNVGADIVDFMTLMQNTPVAKIQPAALSIMIDIPADVGHKRKLDGTPLAYLQERRRSYLSIPNSEQVLRLDGTKNVAQVQQSIRHWVTTNLRL